MRRMAGLAAVGLMVMAACTPSTEPTEQVTRRSRTVDLGPERLQLAAALETFDECGEVLDYFQTSAVDMGSSFAWGGGRAVTLDAFGDDVAAAEGGSDLQAGGRAAEQDAAAAPPPQAGVDYSGTNVQEAGVDEPDIVKTDGRLIVAIARNRLHVVDASGDAPVLRGTLDLGTTNSYGGEVFLAGDRVLLLTNGWRQDATSRDTDTDTDTTSGGGDDGFIGAPDAEIGIAPEQAGHQVAILTAVDISNPDQPRIANRMELDGEYVTARLVGDVARIVVRSTPQLQIQPLPGAETEAELERQVETVVEDTAVEDWLPSVRTDDGEPEPLVACDAVSRPAEPSGVGTVTVVTVDASRDLAIADSLSVVASAETVYASTGSLYVATNMWTDPRILQEQATDDAAAPPFLTTELHKFDITDPAKTAYVASGRVRGHLLNQWSLSEHDGHLRAATTQFPQWFPTGEQTQSESFMTVFRQESDTLAQVGQVGGLGRDEQIYAVRYFGDTGYVVTFRQTDPLYVLDLSDPAAPRVAGELKILGYSSYLHPVGDGLLLGVGQDATDEGRTLGTQLSLFDVSDPTNPTRLHQVSVPGGHSTVEFDHRAFLWWPAEALAALPIQIYDERVFAEPAEPVEPAEPQREGDDTVASSPPPAEPYVGVVGFTVDAGTGFAERGRLTHGGGRSSAEPYAAQIMRSVVIGDALYTLSDVGLLASDLDSFADRGWISF